MKIHRELSDRSCHLRVILWQIFPPPTFSAEEFMVETVNGEQRILLVGNKNVVEADVLTGRYLPLNEALRIDWTPFSYSMCFS